MKVTVIGAGIIGVTTASGSMAEGIAPASKTHGLTPIVCTCPSCIMFQVHAAFLIDAAGRVVQQDGEGQKSWA